MEPGTISEILREVADIKNLLETRTRRSWIKLATWLAWPNKAVGSLKRFFNTCVLLVFSELLANNRRWSKLCLSSKELTQVMLSVV